MRGDWKPARKPSTCANAVCAMVQLAATCCANAALAADIYASVDASGNRRYASQKLDSSYQLLIADERGADGKPQAPNSAGLRKKRSGQPEAFRPLIRAIARKHGVDAALVEAIIDVESGFNCEAHSPRGALGLMQLMPSTARHYGARDGRNAHFNVEAGVRYLKDLLRDHHGNLPLTLAAYNAGQGAVSKYGISIPPYKETMLFVPAVLVKYEQLKKTTYIRE